MGNMKNIIGSALFVGFLTVCGALAGWLWSEDSSSTTYYETTLFSMVLSSDDLSSVEEKETASHFFAEAVLGWTLSPAFRSDLGFDMFSRKQERANMVFEISSSSEQEAVERTQTFIDVMTKKLNSYNEKAKTQFAILFDAPQTSQKEVKKSYWTVGGMAGGFFLGLMLLEGWRFARREK